MHATIRDTRTPGENQHDADAHAGDRRPRPGCDAHTATICNSHTLREVWRPSMPAMAPIGDLRFSTHEHPVAVHIGQLPFGGRISIIEEFTAGFDSSFDSGIGKVGWHKYVEMGSTQRTGKPCFFRGG